MRKEEGLCTEKMTHKRRAQEDTKDTPKPKKKHGCTSEGMDKGNLIQEAQSWSPDEIVNWTALAKRYGVTTPNGGQSLKEFLQQHNVPAAFINQKENRTPRRKQKRLPGGVTFPMHRPVNIQKEVLQQRVETGEILLGEEIVETYYTRFTVEKSTKSVRESTASVHARKISLMDIRKKLLDKHEKTGLLREKSDDVIDSLSEDEVKVQLNMVHGGVEETDPRACLKKISRQRFLKVWHDHTSIAGHGHLLVLVSCVYDPAFYYTTEELGTTMDVQHIVEEPEVHILARSKSSLQDQTMFTQCRIDCLCNLSTTLFTHNGVPINDVMRFFHGDGPAQQFEAGQHIGGDYFCVGCTVKSCRADDLAYAFRSQHLTITDRQAFVLQGKSWEK